jgi:putative ABC transport system permease protein
MPRSFWRPLARGLRALVRGAEVDRAVDDEIGQYVDEATREGIESGLSPDHARRRALREVGSLAAARDQVRASGWEHTVITTLADVRYALRRLRLAPAFTVTAVATLAIGIGAATAIFSAIDPILLRPLPYPDGWQIQSIQDRGRDGMPLDVTFGTYRELSARLHSCDALAVMKPWRPTLSGTQTPERLDGQRVSAEYFRVLGIAPRIGRTFTDLEDRPKGPNVAILSDGLWRRRFSANPALVGRTVTLDGASFFVVGVMPPGFENVTAASAEIWAPLQYDPALPADGREWGHHLRLIARVRDPLSADALRSDIDDVARHPVSAFARPQWAMLNNGLTVLPLQDEVTAGVRGSLLALAGGVLLLLAIACVNITNLLLVRAAQRRSEIAIRTALGATRWRLARQLVVETLLLSLLGGAAGLAMATAATAGLVALSPVPLPRVASLTVDALQQASLRSTPAHYRTRRVLAAAQMALAVVLLVCSGLLYRSVHRLFAVAPGFEPSGVLVMQVQTSGPRYATQASIASFFGAARDTVLRVPGIDAAAFTNQLPLSGDDEQYGVRLDDAEPAQGQSSGSAYRYAVLPGYIEAMGIPLVRGRAFTLADKADAPHVAIISRSLARERFADRDPVGRHVVVGDAPVTIVGVVEDVRQLSLAARDLDAIYVPAAQVAFREPAMWLVARGRGNIAALAPSIEAAIWSIDKDQPITRVDTLDAVLARSAGERRFVLVVLEIFAAVAIVLAALGVYGVLAASVAERTREIGIRAALGASPDDVRRLIAREAAVLSGSGLLFGIAAAAVSSRLLISLLFGTSRLDPATYATVGALLVCVAAAATVIPARRAARLDPATTLRMD